jgi:hypothetical protein
LKANDTPPCASCGSIRTRAIKGGVFERIVAMLSNQYVLVCGRCGWRGRGRRSSSVARSAHRGARSSRPMVTAESQTDGHIDLTALDRAMQTDNAGKAERDS